MEIKKIEDVKSGTHNKESISFAQETKILNEILSVFNIMIENMKKISELQNIKNQEQMLSPDSPSFGFSVANDKQKTIVENHPLAVKLQLEKINTSNLNQNSLEIIDGKIGELNKEYGKHSSFDKLFKFSEKGIGEDKIEAIVKKEAELESKKKDFASTLSPQLINIDGSYSSAVYENRSKESLIESVKKELNKENGLSLVEITNELSKIDNKNKFDVLDKINKGEIKQERKIDFQI